MGWGAVIFIPCEDDECPGQNRHHDDMMRLVLVKDKQDRVLDVICKRCGSKIKTVKR